MIAIAKKKRKKTPKNMSPAHKSLRCTQTYHPFSASKKLFIDDLLPPIALRAITRVYSFVTFVSLYLTSLYFIVFPTTEFKNIDEHQVPPLPQPPPPSILVPLYTPPQIKKPIEPLPKPSTFHCKEWPGVIDWLWSLQIPILAADHASVNNGADMIVFPVLRSR